MTKAAAIYNFWAGFGLPAYEENCVPTGAESPAFPYLTYQLVTGAFDESIMMTASLWYRGTSWTEANAKADEISQKISAGGMIINCDGGAVWIHRGSPFAQRLGDDSDSEIKRVYINIYAEFFTEN